MRTRFSSWRICPWAESHAELVPAGTNGWPLQVSQFFNSTNMAWQGSELFSVRTEATSPLLSTTKRDNWALLSALVFLSVTWWGWVGSCPVYTILITCAQRLEDPRLSYAGGLRCVLTKEYWEQVSNVSSLRTVYTVRPDWLQLSTTLYYSSRDSWS